MFQELQRSWLLIKSKTKNYDKSQGFVFYFFANVTLVRRLLSTLNVCIVLYLLLTAEKKGKRPRKTPGPAANLGKILLDEESDAVSSENNKLEVNASPQLDDGASHAALVFSVQKELNIYRNTEVDSNLRLPHS